MTETRETREQAIQEYTKKPATIKAFRWSGHEAAMKTLFELNGDTPIVRAPDDPHVEAGFGFSPCEGIVMIPTLEGTMSAKPGDWIIRGIKGELYPCKHDIFTESYDAARSAPEAGTARCPSCGSRDRWIRRCMIENCGYTHADEPAGILESLDHRKSVCSDSWHSALASQPAQSAAPRTGMPNSGSKG